MTDQGVKENGLNRPGSGNAFGPGLGAAPKPLSEAELRRQEKLQLLRDKQNSDRLKKLEELKEHVSINRAELNQTISFCGRNKKY